MTPVDDDVRAALDGWRDELLDLTGANRLINLRPDSPGSLEIAGPSPKSIVEALRQGDDCGFAGAEGVPEHLDPRPALTLRTRVPEEIMRPVVLFALTLVAFGVDAAVIVALAWMVAATCWRWAEAPSPILRCLVRHPVFLPLPGGRLEGRSQTFPSPAKLGQDCHLEQQRCPKG